MVAVPFGSVEYLTIPVSVTGDEAITEPTVEVAITARSVEPGADDWQAAQWTGSEARTLLTGEEPKGSYFVWVRITDSPERPIRLAGLLTIN